MAKRFKEIIDPSYYKRLAEIESGNNPNAKAPTSSATGLYQFTEGTWKGLTEQMGLDFTLDDRKDPDKSKLVVEQFTKQNRNYLKSKLGREPNSAELYLAHFAGMGGSSKLLQGLQENPEAGVDTIASPSAIKANRSIFLNKDGSFKKTKDIYNWAAKKFGEKEYEAEQKPSNQTPVQYQEEREVKKDAVNLKQKSYLKPETKKEFDEVKFQDDIIKGVKELLQPKQEQQINPFKVQPKEQEKAVQQDNSFDFGYDLYRPEENEFLNEFLQ